MEAIENSKKIYERLCSVMAEIEAVTKDKKNPQQGYNYRSIDDVYNMLQPVFGRNKIFILPNVIEIKEEERQSKSGGTLFYTTIEMEYSFYTDDGSSVTTKATGKAMDSGDKSLDKAKSSAIKNLLLQMFIIPTIEEKDTETASPEVKPKVQQEQKVSTEPPSKELYTKFIDRINEINNMFELDNWGKKHKSEIDAMPSQQQTDLRELYKARKETIKALASMDTEPSVTESPIPEDTHNPE